jgi:TfoX/Sxy family transcriptional regulator of competence genes
MAYDEGLATRVRGLIGSESGLVEKGMFGGLAFLLDGNMAVGVRGEDLIVRTDPATYEADLSQPGVRAFGLSRRPMKGWLMVDTAGHGEDDNLRRWVGRGVEYARGLPPK